MQQLARPVQGGRLGTKQQLLALGCDTSAALRITGWATFTDPRKDHIVKFGDWRYAECLFTFTAAAQGHRVRSVQGGAERSA